MNGFFIVLLMMAAGVFIGFQSPINAALSKRTGILEAGMISFAVGLLVLAFVVCFFGKGNLRGVLHAPLWQWTGGLLGAIYVTSIIVAVPRIGVSTAMMAAIAGQLLIGILIDHFGWFGVNVHPLDWRRITGALMMMAAVWLIFGSPKPMKQHASTPPKVSSVQEDSAR